MTGHSLCRTFGEVRARLVGGFPWQSVRVARGAAADMAEAINDEPGARADVVPTMELLLRKAQEGKAGDRSVDIIKQPSFGFGAWLSQWTALREELHGKTPRRAPRTAAL